MKRERQIIPYQSATLNNIDAGTIIEYPNTVNNATSNSYYYTVPSFLIIGAMKCGTTELTAWLLQHPNLEGIRREHHFFDEVLDIDKEWKRYALSPHFRIQKYSKKLNLKAVHTFEKTTEYFDKTNRGRSIPRLIQKMMPSGRFIVILRNPIERAYSAYQMNQLSKKFRPPLPGYREKSFVETIEDYFEKKENSAFYRDFKVGHYATHLENWLSCFPRKQLLVLFTNDLKKKPFKTMEKVQQFLDLPNFDYRTIIEQIPEGTWRLGDNTTKDHYRAYDPMSQKAQELLDAYYAPHNEALKQLLPELIIPW